MPLLKIPAEDMRKIEKAIIAGRKENIMRIFWGLHGDLKALIDALGVLVYGICILFIVHF